MYLLKIIFKLYPKISTIRVNQKKRNVGMNLLKRNYGEKWIEKTR